MSFFLGTYLWADEPIYCTAPQISEHVIVEGSEGGKDSAMKSVRRRRREEIGREYVRGRVPLIQSAQLKGPFDRKSGWTNPWRYIPEEVLSAIPSLLSLVDDKTNLDGHDQDLRLDSVNSRVKRFCLPVEGDKSASRPPNIQTISTVADNSGFSILDHHNNEECRVNHQPAASLQRGSFLDIAEEQHHELSQDLLEGRKRKSPREWLKRGRSLKKSRTSPNEPQSPSPKGHLEHGTSKHRQRSPAILQFYMASPYTEPDSKNNFKERTQRSSATIESGISNLEKVNYRDSQNTKLLSAQRASSPRRAATEMTDISILREDKKPLKIDPYTGMHPAEFCADSPSHDFVNISATTPSGGFQYRKIIRRTKSGCSTSKIRRKYCNTGKADENVAYMSDAFPLKPPKLPGDPQLLHEASLPVDFTDITAMHRLASRAKKSTTSVTDLPLSTETTLLNGSQSSSRFPIFNESDYEKSPQAELMLDSAGQSPWVNPNADFIEATFTPTVSSDTEVSDNDGVIIKSSIFKEGETVDVDTRSSPLLQIDSTFAGRCNTPADDFVRPFQDLMTPSPEMPQTRLSQVYQMPSTQMLLHAATTNPWDSLPKNRGRFKDPKKRVSFGPTSLEKESNVSPVCEMRQTTNLGLPPVLFKTRHSDNTNDGLQTNIGGDGSFISNTSQSLSKAMQNKITSKEFQRSSPGLEAMAEAFIAADQRTSSEDIHKPKVSESNSSPQNVQCDKKETKGSTEESTIVSENGSLAQAPPESDLPISASFCIAPNGRITEVKYGSGLYDTEENIDTVINDMGSFLEGWDVDMELKRVNTQNLENTPGMART